MESNTEKVRLELQSKKLAEAFAWGMRPDPILTVSTWADRHRILSKKASAEPGHWDTNRTPYAKEIMDSLSNDSIVQDIVFMKGAQIGGTEIGNNWIGYVIHHAPGPMLAVQPTVETAKRNSKTRIAPLIEECPELMKRVRDPRSRDSGNTVLAKEFPGGILTMTGANSGVGLRSMPARYLFLDEVDGYPTDVDGEGDPIELAKARSRTFSKRKCLQVSTPTIKDRSKIERAYLNTDQRKYFVPCPHCGFMQELIWKQVKWKQGEERLAWYECVECEKKIEEHHKTQMLLAGEWRPTNLEFNNPKVRGYHLSSLYSPLGWFSWGDAAEQFVKAKGKQDSLRVFVNTVLGETWAEKGDAPEWNHLYARRENYKIGTCPEDVLFLTCGIDIQKDRIEGEVVGWGRGKRSWSIDYFVLPGDTSNLNDQCWNDLELTLSNTYPHASGLDLPISIAAIDTGYNTQVVYMWARKYPGNKVIPIKGSDTLNAAIGMPKAVDVNTKGRVTRYGVKVWPVGVSVIKSELYGWLRQSVPEENQEYPVGFCHFPEYSSEYFKQLTAEEVQAREVKGYKKYEWHKIRERNEALDCRVYARAAAAMKGMDRWDEASWNKIEMEKSVSKTIMKKETVKKAEKSRKNTKRNRNFWN